MIEEDESAERSEDADGAASAPGSRAEAVRIEHAQQLIRYLQKTAHVSGPARDLIHLESPGAAFGLDSTFADRLDDDAVNGRSSQVIASIDA